MEGVSLRLRHRLRQAWRSFWNPDRVRLAYGRGHRRALVPFQQALKLMWRKGGNYVQIDEWMLHRWLCPDFYRYEDQDAFDAYEEELHGG